MGDEKDGETPALFQLREKGQNLGLNGHVQGGGGLVGYEQAGIGGQGQGDHHPLLHPPTQLMRIGPDDLRRIWQAHSLQHLQGPLASDPPRHRLVLANHQLDLLPHGEDRIEGGSRILEDHGDARPTDVPHLLLAQRQNIPTIEGDPAIYDLTRGWDQAEEREAGHRLAAAGLTHQSKDLPSSDVKGHAVDGVHDPGVGAEVDV